MTATIVDVVVETSFETMVQSVVNPYFKLVLVGTLLPILWGCLLTMILSSLTGVPTFRTNLLRETRLPFSRVCPLTFILKWLMLETMRLLKVRFIKLLGLLMLKFLTTLKLNTEARASTSKLLLILLGLWLRIGTNMFKIITLGYLLPILGHLLL